MSKEDGKTSKGSLPLPFTSAFDLVIPSTG